MKRTLCLIFAILLFGCSCMYIGEDNPVKKDIESLSGPQFSGRLSGTDGNALAAEFILTELSGYGLEPLNADDMLVPFEAELPVSISSNLVVEGMDGSLTSLEEGVDYIAPLISSVDLKGDFSASGSKAGDEETIQVVDENGDAVLVLTSNLFRSGWRSNPEDDSVPQISLTSSGIDKIGAAKEGAISFRCTTEVEPIQLNNVMALLPGEDSTRAIVVGAHFDHMGQSGQTFYPGAVDNASGVAAVLQVARLLAKAQPPVDIVFAFWNAEEHGRLGSKSGETLISQKYATYCYLNIDCIGYKDGGQIEISSANGSTTLCKTLEDEIKQAGFSDIQFSSQTVTSDHMSFNDCGSIHFGYPVESLAPILHKPSDDAQQIDFKEITDFSKALSAVIEQSAENILNASQQTVQDSSILWPGGEYNQMSSQEKSLYSQEIAAQLDYDECVILRDSGQDMILKNTERSFFKSIEAVKTFYPDLSLEETINDSGFIGARIFDGGLPSEYAYNQVLQWTPSIETISSIYLYYAPASNPEIVWECRINSWSASKENYAQEYEEIESLRSDDSMFICRSDANGYLCVKTGKGVSFEVRIGRMYDYDGTQYFVSEPICPYDEFRTLSVEFLDISSVS